MSLFRLILLIGIVQGFFLGIALIIKNYDKKKQNYYFLSLVFLISIALLSKFLFTKERYNTWPQIWFLADLIAYCIGPLWYFTIQKSIFPKVQIKLKEWLLLSPTLFHIGFLLFIFCLTKDELLQASESFEFALSFYVFCLTVLIVNSGYLLKAHRLLKEYRDSQFPNLLIKGQYVFLVILVVWMLAFLLSFLLANVYTVNINTYNFAFISFAFLTFGLAFLALIRPASFYFLTQTFDSSETYVLQQIAESVELYIREHEPYLQAGFSLNQLAKEIDSNPTLTSKAINRILKTSYSDLMNEYRVKHFLAIAQEEQWQRLTHWAIAQEVGFGNKVSFYKAFRKLTGTTPKQYFTSA